MATIIQGNVQRKADPVRDLVRGRYSFEVFDKAKTRKLGLKLSFLDIRVLHAADTIIITERHGQKTQWPLYKEESLQHAFRKSPMVKCIISFQMFDDGEYFAVARVYKEKEGC